MGEDTIYKGSIIVEAVLARASVLSASSSMPVSMSKAEKHPRSSSQVEHIDRNKHSQEINSYHPSSLSSGPPL